LLTDLLEAKRLGLLHEVAPQSATFGFLCNPRFASAETQMHDMQEAARVLAIKLRVFPASSRIRRAAMHSEKACARLLRARRKRPRDCCAAKQCDERAAPCSAAQGAEAAWIRSSANAATHRLPGRNSAG